MDIPHCEHCLHRCYSPHYKTTTVLQMLSAVTTEQNGTVRESIKENIIIHFFRRFLINLVCKLEEVTTFFYHPYSWSGLKSFDYYNTVHLRYKILSDRFFIFYFIFILNNFSSVVNVFLPGES